MVYRSRVGEIVFEFTMPQKRQKGIVFILNGMPSVPKLSDLLETLAANGYVAIFPRYKGTWESAGIFLAESPVNDVKLLCDEILKKKTITELYAYKKFKIASKNMMLVGSSFGGAIALCGASWPSVKKVIALSPVVNWKSSPDTATLQATERLKSFLKFANGTLFAPPETLPENVSKKITIVFDESDKTTPPKEIIDYAKTNKIALKKKTGLGHISFSKFPPEKLIKLLADRREAPVRSSIFAELES